MLDKQKSFWQLIKQTFSEFAEDDCPSMAAALAYYTVFSLPPLLVIVITVAGMFWNPETIQGGIETEIKGMVGESGKEQIHNMIAEAGKSQRRGWATAIGVVVLLVGATGAFAQLQHALNKTWEVEPDPKQGGIMNFIMKRILSLGMVLAVAFLLLVSLILTTVLSAAGDALGGMLPSGISAIWPIIINFVVSFLVIWLLFAAMFRFLPDAEIAWRDVWFGAAITTLLFMLGKILIGVYLGTQASGAGPIILILLWIYYSAMILLIGAEFTQVWARSYGNSIEPKKGAVRVVQKKVVERHGQASPAAVTHSVDQFTDRLAAGSSIDDAEVQEQWAVDDRSEHKPSTAKRIFLPLCVGGCLWYLWSSHKRSKTESF